MKYQSFKDSLKKNLDNNYLVDTYPEIKIKLIVNKQKKINILKLIL